MSFVFNTHYQYTRAQDILGRIIGNVRYAKMWAYSFGLDYVTLLSHIYSLLFSMILIFFALHCIALHKKKNCLCKYNIHDCNLHPYSHANTNFSLTNHNKFGSSIIYTGASHWSVHRCYPGHWPVCSLEGSQTRQSPVSGSGTLCLDHSGMLNSMIKVYDIVWFLI